MAKDGEPWPRTVALAQGGVATAQKRWARLRACAVLVGAFVMGVAAWTLAVAAPTLAAPTAASTSAATQGYSVAAAIPGPDGHWDYAAVDPNAHRFYLARNGVAVLDLTTQRWLDTLSPQSAVNGVLPLTALGKLVFTDSKQPGLVIFDTTTMTAVARVKIDSHPDALAFDPATGLVAIMTGGMRGTVTLVSLEKASVVGRVAVGGKLEFAASNGRGTLYINVATADELAVLDLATQKITGRIALRDCHEPTGLAYEPQGDLLIAACDKVAKVIRASDGADLASLPIGEGADAVIGDPVRHRAFIPCGESGTLVVLDLTDPEHAKVEQTVTTQAGARTGALDQSTGRIYLPTGKPGPIIPPNHWPSILPHTFKVLVVSGQ